MSAPVQAPVLVYDRISANRRRTWALLAGSALLLSPLAVYAAEYLGLWAIMILGPLVKHWAIAFGVGALLVVLIPALEYCYAERLVLRMLQAKPAGAQEESVRRLAENLAIGCGLPAPRVLLVETTSLNAFSVGTDPARSTMVLTRGLLTSLDRRQLEAVIAHELSHIGNHDTRLGTLLAAIVATLWLPARIVKKIFGFFYRIHPALWMAALLWWGFMLAIAADGFLDVLSEVIKGEWIWLVPLLTSTYVVLGSPFLGILLRRAIWSQREFLADADAVLLTRDPSALREALEKIAQNSTMKVNPATAHLPIADPLGASTALADRLFAAHPPMKERISLLQRMGPGLPPESSASELSRVAAPVSLLQILSALETWPKKTYAALALFFFPILYGLAAGTGRVLQLFELAQLAVLLLAVLVVRRWRYSRALLTQLLDGPMFPDTSAQAR